MIKKFIKLSFILLIIFATLLALLIKNPHYIGLFVDKFSHHTLDVSNIDIQLSDKILTLSSNHITLENNNIASVISGVSLTINFSDFYNPHSSIITKDLDINIKQISSKNNTLNTAKTISQSSFENNFENLPWRFVDVQKLRLTYKDFAINGRLQIKDMAGKQLITGLVEQVDVATSLKYLHLLPFKKVVNYLQTSLKTGNVSNLHYTILNSDTITFDISGKINNGYINFHQQWDHIHNISADFVINNKHMLINFDNAKIHKLNAKGSVKIDWENDLFVEVNSKIIDNTQIVLDFLRHSPLPQHIKTGLNHFQANGAITATLNLHIPITAKNQKIQTIVNAQLINNNFSTLNNKINIHNIDAKLVFDNSLSINGVANVFNTQSTIDVVLKDYLDVTIFNQEGEIRINNKNNLWNASIYNTNIIGDIILDLNKKIPKIYLKNFAIHDTNKQHSNNHINIVATEVPSFDLVTKNIQINNKSLPNVSSSFIHKKDGLHIKNLEFEGITLKGKNIQFNGLWVNNITSFYTTLSGERLNDLFESFNISEKTSGGKFALDIRGSCLCKPWEINSKNISGYAQATVKQGSFTTQDNNIGKILSLLNITSLTKKLSLNTDEIVDSGFAYDSINAEIILNNGGVADIENFNLLSASNNIELTGSSNIDLQSYNLKALVVPAIKDSIPIATALAGGGLAGLGVWLLDKVLFKEELLESVIGTVTNFEYKITGDWNNPQIEKL